MKMNFDLSMQQTQKLIMTQQLQLAIMILQLPSLELNEYIQNQLVENPVLEANVSERPYEEPRIDWKEYIKNYDQDKRGYDEGISDEDENASPLNFVASVTTLRDHLLFQLHLTVRGEENISIGEYLVDNIDNAGYLRVDTSDAAKQLSIDQEKVENILRIIQSFDPPGVGARDLKECLLIQLREQETTNEILEKVISNYLKEIADNKYNIIAKELSITAQEAQQIGDIVKSLEPKPGRGFADTNEIKYIVPDVVVEKIDGIYVVMVNDRINPMLSINPYYREILRDGTKDEAARDYIKKKLDTALWLIKSIEQRRSTIYNVVNSIVSFQTDFLDRGMDYLKPLTLKEVAEAVGIHESTVSRAINGKYVQTPRGLYNLKFFFTRGIDAVQGDNVSSESIKKTIKEIIEGEDAKKPVSDQKITDMLNRDGINISRRTVAKYREEMGIPSTSKRKRF